MQNIFPVLIQEVLSQYALNPKGTHGVSHWARVALYGRFLCRHTGVDPFLTDLFAIFHDSRRYNESFDPGHGKRGAALAEKLNKKYSFISKDKLILLTEACRHHTDGKTKGDITIQTCWDADRLDLERVGKIPNPKYMCTTLGKEKSTIEWTRPMAMKHYLAEEILSEWGIDYAQFR